jgi:hypothetical protein
MTMPASMTTDEITRARAVFAQDQEEAGRHQRTETSSVAVARTLVVLYAVLGAYALLAMLGFLPAAGWSPLGQ